MSGTPDWESWHAPYDDLSSTRSWLRAPAHLPMSRAW